MKTTILQLRQARGWTQDDLAQAINSTRRRVSRLETGARGATEDEIQAICKACDCPIDDLVVERARGSGRPTVPGKDLLRPFLVSAPQPKPKRNSASRLETLRRVAAEAMSEVDNKLHLWMPFLESVDSDSEWETLHHIRCLRDGAEPTLLTVYSTGFDVWPACDWKTGRSTGHHLRPALVTPDWLIIYQVGIATLHQRFRLDGLLVVTKPRRTFLDLEIDGSGHDEDRDRFRRGKHGMLELRIAGKEVWAGPSITERLRQQNLAEPARRES